MKALTFSPATLVVSYFPVDLPMVALLREMDCFTVFVTSKENFLYRPS